MPKFLPLLSATVLSASAVSALAQEAAPVRPAVELAANTTTQAPEIASPDATKKKGALKAPPATPAPAADGAIPEATPAAKKPNLLQRIFGSRQPKATPAPDVVATPAASPTPGKSGRKVPSTPAPAPDASTPKPGKPGRPEKATPVPSPDKIPATPKPEKPAATPKPGKVAPAPKPEGVEPTATPPVKKSGKTKLEAAPKVAANEPPEGADPEEKEKFRFDQAKTKAMEDPQVLSLKTKADNAATDEESRKALRVYNKALFEKIRKIDNSVSDRATRMEAAIMKRLAE